ncbi:MAG: uracil-DNA glycosylase family protein [Planctomycetota bacterium]|jgi:single-strand selective monofunctional uracil DNA glycosylase
MSLAKATKRVIKELAELEFGPPVDAVYNPLVHARASHSQYLERYGQGTKRYLLLGMNPGPFGMVQTGIPFGEIEHVRDWLEIEAAVDKPEQEHPKRPVLGFDCTRSEVSGKRLWSWCKQRFETPERFFSSFFVHNYCPLAFMVESGGNLTPDKLKAEEKKPLFEICDRYLQAVVDALQPEMIIGVGAFAEKQARKALAGMDLQFGRIPHPSPASPLANRGWAEAAEAAFKKLGVDLSDSGS